MGGCTDLGVGTAANVFAAGIIGIYRHVRYVFIYRKNLKEFDEKIKLLGAKRESVQQEVDAAERNLETIKPDVKHWCERVDKTIDEEVKKVKDLEDKAKAKCFIGLCPNIKSRYQLSRKAEEDVAVVDQHLKGGEFRRVADPVAPEALISAAPKNFTAFDSRKVVFDKIVEALKDPTLSMIGVYGTGGVGKTTLVNEVARHVKEIDLFCPVVVVTVTLTPDIKNIQETIAASLGLKLQEYGESVREHKLMERLEKEKKILIVLDDIWRGSEVKQVGIPFGDQYKGCKILLTSRDRHLLTNEMDVETTFPMDALDENEAWNLFKKMAEINDFENSELQSVATDIVKRCAGLPLAIVTVARALRNKELAEWMDALRQLERPSPENFNGIPEAVYSAIQLSYNNLKGKGLKETFLLSCLLGYNACIEDLLRFAMGLKLYGDTLITVEETRNRVLTMASRLKACCLLLDNGDSDDRLVMHDLVLDVALAIASRDNHAFALRHGDVFEEWPDEERMKNFKMICLNFASIKKLPHELDCPQLTLFSMVSRGWNSYVEMPPSFFEKTKNIKVLDLIRVDFWSSPSSISLPTSLRTLCLKQCRLRRGDMARPASLGELKNLEILSLSESDIEMLPVEIGRLTKLRSLDLTACRELRIIPPGVLSSLPRLEELYMRGVTVGWNQQGNAHVDELKELSRLTTLDICILDADVPKDLFFEKLQRCKILIGVEWRGWEDFGYSRTIKLGVNTSIDHLDHGVKVLLKKTEALYLENLEGVKIVLNQVGNRDCFLHLNHLGIQNAFEIQYIMNDDDAVDKIAFRQLRSLTLRNLPQLISFCSENRSEGSTSVQQPELPLFGEKMELPRLEGLHLSNINVVGRIWHNQFSTLENLTTLKIMSCDNLKDILSSLTAKSLAHLQSFEIRRCKRLRKIIFSEDIEDDDKATISFPQLSTLRMECLKHFVGFCSENYNIAFPSLKELEIKDCPKLRGFIYKSTAEDSSPLSMQAVFDEKVTFPQLEELRLCGFKNCKKIWNDQLADGSFSKLKNLFVFNCDRLLNIFSFSMSERLQNLVKFEVQKCVSLEEIFEPATSSIVKETTTSFIFPKLTFLYFDELPKLRSFCSQIHTTECPSLKEIWLNGCDMVEIIFASTSLRFRELTNQQPLFCVNEVTHLKKEEHNLSGAGCKLKSPEVRDCGKLKNLVPSSMSFENLTTLNVSRCHGFVKLIACSTAKSLVQLRSMRIFDCDMIEEIIASEGDEVKGGIVFTHLKHLELNGLQSLASFCSGKHSFEFPALKEVSVIGCLEMKIFSQGDSSTPMLKRVQFSESKDKVCWKGSLNATILWMFAKKVGYREMEWLSLSDSSKWMEICRRPQGVLSFKSLQSLKVHDCSSLRRLFTLSIALDLPQLYGIEVKNCILMEHIIVDEGSDEEILENKIVFPWLKYITLESCADLASFYHGSKIMKCPSLMELYVIDCPEMFAFASTFSREQSMKTIDDRGNTSRLSIDATFFNNMVEFPQLKGLMVKRIGNCKKIWHDHLIDDSFSKLNILEVRNCDKLLNVFSLNMCHRLQNLKKFKVRKCDSLEEIFEPQVFNANELLAMTATKSIVFTSLDYLQLSNLPSLVSFCYEKHNFEFPSLKKMIMRKCPKMKIFCKGDLSAPQLQNVILAEDEDENEEIWRWKGNLKTTIQWMFEEKNVQNPEDEDEDDEEMWPQDVGLEVNFFKMEVRRMEMMETMKTITMWDMEMRHVKTQGMIINLKSLKLKMINMMTMMNRMMTMMEMMETIDVMKEGVIQMMEKIEIMERMGTIETKIKLVKRKNLEMMEKIKTIERMWMGKTVKKRNMEMMEKIKMMEMMETMEKLKMMMENIKTMEMAGNMEHDDDDEDDGEGGDD